MSLKNIKELCVEYFQNEDIKREIKEILKPIAKTKMPWYPELVRFFTI